MRPKRNRCGMARCASVAQANASSTLSLTSERAGVFGCTTDASREANRAASLWRGPCCTSLCVWDMPTPGQLLGRPLLGASMPRGRQRDARRRCEPVMEECLWPNAPQQRSLQGAAGSRRLDRATGRPAAYVENTRFGGIVNLCFWSRLYTFVHYSAAYLLAVSHAPKIDRQSIGG